MSLSPRKQLAKLAAIAPVIPGWSVFSWESQAPQYPTKNEFGITYFRGEMPGDTRYVNCLLYYLEDGSLGGILNHYPFDFPLEKKGNIFLLVRPDCRRQGIGGALLRAADEIYKIDFTQQKFSPVGLTTARAYLQAKIDGRVG